MINTTSIKSLSTFGVFDSKEKTEENRYIREQEKHVLGALHEGGKIIIYIIDIFY